MEKKLILEFLDTHWEEFISLLTGNRSVTVIPKEVREFAALLDKLIGHNSAPIYTADTNTASTQAHTKDADTKGLLRKAQTFRRKRNQNSSDCLHSIINENGLFLVQKETKPNSLDPVFKKLVDSVL